MIHFSEDFLKSDYLLIILFIIFQLKENKTDKLIVIHTIITIY
jgi:hypothetical protein